MPSKHLTLKCAKMDSSPDPSTHPACSLMVKSLRAIQETQVQSLDPEDPLEEETATHTSIRAWRVPWTEEPGRLQSMVLQKVRHDSATKQ